MRREDRTRRSSCLLSATGRAQQMRTRARGRVRGRVRTYGAQIANWRVHSTTRLRAVATTRALGGDDDVGGSVACIICTASTALAICARSVCTTPSSLLSCCSRCEHSIACAPERRSRVQESCSDGAVPPETAQGDWRCLEVSAGAFTNGAWQVKYEAAIQLQITDAETDRSTAS
eukprot:6175632-Pleurochrysis_carterae.AAC.1